MSKMEKYVEFRFFKEALDVKTEKAQLIKCGFVANPIKVWIPNRMIEIIEDEESANDNMLLIRIPLWLFTRTELPKFTTYHLVEK